MINKQIIDFNENLLGLRDFVDLIDPFLNEKIEEHNKHVKPFVLLPENKYAWFSENKDASKMENKNA